jgi:hypothetical protein
MKESYPLAWPEGWVRTRPQDRKVRAAWNKPQNFYRLSLEKELGRMKVVSFVISSNVPLNLRGAMTAGVEPLDPGVSVWFSRQGKEDFVWQDALGIHDPAPSEEQVISAYRRLAQLYHPDRGGDVEMFKAVTRHRDNALRWINRKTSQAFDLVLAADQFKEVRHNMAALAGTLRCIRQIEGYGTTSLLERAFKGFAALPESVGEREDEHVVSSAS